MNMKFGLFSIRNGYMTFKQFHEEVHKPHQLWTPDDTKSEKLRSITVS